MYCVNKNIQPVVLFAMVFVAIDDGSQCGIGRHSLVKSKIKDFIWTRFVYVCVFVCVYLLFDKFKS